MRDGGAKEQELTGRHFVYLYPGASAFLRCVPSIEETDCPC